jgi:plasmid maintenance system antidote protein VapI
VLIAQNQIDGIRRQRQGISRAISPSAVLTVAVALELSGALGTPPREALDLAKAVLLGEGEHRQGELVTVRVDVRAVERRMAIRLAEAVEAHPQPRRGRPVRGR